MTSALKPPRTEREESCFTRAARAIRRVLSRICTDRTSSSIEASDSPPRPPRPRRSERGYVPCSFLISEEESYDDIPHTHSPPNATSCDFLPLSLPPTLGPYPKSYTRMGHRLSGIGLSPDLMGSCCRKSLPETRMFAPPGQKRRSSGPSLGSEKKCRMEPFGLSSAADSSDQDKTEETEDSTVQFSLIEDEEEEEEEEEDSAAFQDREEDRQQSSGGAPSPPVSDRKHTDDGDLSFNSQSAPPPPGPGGGASLLQDRPVCSAGSSTRDACEFWSARSDGDPAGGGDAAVETELPVTKPTPPDPLGVSGRLRRSRSTSSLSRSTSTEVETLRRAGSVSDMLLHTGCEDFTPDEEDGTYRVRFSCAGRYHCSVTGLVFHMEAEGDVVYATVPWNRRLLVRHRKKPAGPLFDISCAQRSVGRLHVPHCEVRSTGGCRFLSVAHVKDAGVEFIDPRRITETHVVINVAGFSAYGNVKDGDSPPDPVRALVLLFYRPPADPDPDPEALLNVLLLPRNVVLQDVRRSRKKLVGDEIYMETPPHCKLRPKQEYVLSTSPEDDSIRVQPTEAEFDEECYDNYFPSFQVSWETVMRHIKLSLRDAHSADTAWERRVCLSSSGPSRSCGPAGLGLPPRERLSIIRSGFVDGISGPVLKSLLDRLLEKKVLADPERESADEIQNQRDKARFVIDTVRKKGEAASSEMVEFLCEADPFLCEHLGLT